MLVGIVLVQIWWIDRVMQLNKKTFDDAVYKSLAAVVKQVEEKENFVFINHQLETDSLLKKTKKLLKKRQSQNSYSFKTNNGSNNSSISISVNSESGKEPQTIVRVEKHHNGKKIVQNSVVAGVLTLDSINTNDIPPVPPQIEIISPEDKQEQVEVIMEKMMSLRDPDSVSIKPGEIKKLLATQLKQNNLPDTFAFSLLSKDPKKSYIEDFLKHKEVMNFYKTNLYPNDLFGREITLVLFFRIPDTHLGEKKWSTPLLLSLFFTLSILVLFIYSIRMLVRHKKMLEMKNDFINHLSHEFKTPLTGISLGADILMEKTGQMNSEQIHKVAGTIKKQSLRLSKEVNDVLQNALLEENINRPCALFNIVETIKTQIELFQPQIEILNASVNTDFSSDKIIINGDEIQWQKVFSNLIDNALKFSRENPEIIISVSSASSKIKIEITDNGIGIAGKDLPHVFEKFFRSDYYKQSNIQGFGLGLSFVKTIVNAHKGIIKAESELNKGTKIIIEINAEA
jgi:two-component system phosphate regulon sensor histidine kinase PhoR